MRAACRKTSTLLYRECRGDHWSPANLAQQRSFGKASHKANGHGRAMLAPTMRFFDSLPQLRLRVLFCAGAGRIRTGRPSADGKKQSCGLFFRPRLANPPAPTKKLWQEYCRSFFLWCTAQSRQSRSPIFKVRFYRDVQPLPGGWIFLVPAFSAVFRMLNFPAAGDRGADHAHPVKSETGHRIAAGTCNPGGKQV